MGYVLITAARNESRFIEATIKSIVAQTRLPDRWVIVSDGSTDGTDDIVRQYASRYSFITLVRMEDEKGRNFASQAYAMNRGISSLDGFPYDYIGCLDADITLEPDYYKKLIRIFERDENLGIAGGIIYEWNGKSFAYRTHNTRRSVPGAIQMFRRKCFACIGTFTPLRNGGLDTVAEIKARMNGFRVEAYPAVRVYHHRRTGGGGKILQWAFRSGLMDYEIGYHPIYELLMCARRISYSPVLLIAAIRIVGFFWAYLRGMRRLVPQEMIDFLRCEQRGRLRGFMSGARVY